MSQRARARIPSTRLERCIWPARSRGRHYRLWRSRRRSPVPTITAPQVVRVAINVDPRDAHVVAVSDAVPQIIGGIPLRLRSIRVSIDRPNFMINPTSCVTVAIASQGIGDQGTVADFSSFFHVDNCWTLPFSPKMTVRAARRGQGHEAQQKPQAALRSLDPARRREPEVRLGDAAEEFRDRPATPQQHLLARAARVRTLRWTPADRNGDDGNSVARPASTGPRIRGVRLREIAPCRVHPVRPGDHRSRGRIVIGQQRSSEDSGAR